MNFADFFAGLHGHGGMEHRLPPPPTEDEVMSLYGSLGLNPGASANEIRKSYLKLARTKHPDRGGDPAEFHKIQEGELWCELRDAPCIRLLSQTSRSGVLRPLPS